MQASAYSRLCLRLEQRKGRAELRDGRVAGIPATVSVQDALVLRRRAFERLDVGEPDVAGAGGIGVGQQRHQPVDIQAGEPGYSGGAQGQGPDMLHEVSPIHPTHQLPAIRPRSAYGSAETEQDRWDPQSGGDPGNQSHITQLAHTALDSRDAALLQTGHLSQGLLRPGGGHADPAEHGPKIVLTQRGGDRVLEIKVRGRSRRGSGPTR
ncbi:MAG: hypothetical protein ACRDRX_24860 [Pseudonocardiaceae bacterium]